MVATKTGWWEACEELGLPGQDAFSDEGSNCCRLVDNTVLDPISGSIPLKAYDCCVNRESEYQAAKTSNYAQRHHQVAEHRFKGQPASRT